MLPKQPESNRPIPPSKRCPDGALSLEPGFGGPANVKFCTATKVIRLRNSNKTKRTKLRQGGHFSKKEVFQPHLPVRLPCYDLAPVTSFTLGSSLRSPTSGTPGFHGLTGGVYKARERIHRAMADARLLAIPASRSRVADSDPN